MESRGSIIEFRIVYFNEKIKKRRPISEFFYVESLIAQRGIANIRMISFYFNDNYYYPYQIHPIMLKPYNNKLYVIFYEYYNVYNQVIGLRIEQKIYDYNRLVQLLDHPNGVLLPIIQPPFITVPIYNNNQESDNQSNLNV